MVLTTYDTHRYLVQRYLTALRPLPHTAAERTDAVDSDDTGSKVELSDAGCLANKTLYLPKCKMTPNLT